MGGQVNGDAVGAIHITIRSGADGVPQVWQEFVMHSASQ